jgi:CHAT domain-containing protein/tetratricopeptide (TPR) repeat protein
MPDFNTIDKKIQEYSESRQYGKAVELLLTTTDNGKSFSPGQLSYFYLQLGSIYNTLGSYDDAIRSIEKATDIITHFGEYQQALPLSYLNLGSFYLNKNQYPQAKEFYEKSLRTALNTDDFKIISSAYRGLGLVSNLLNDYQKSINFLYESLKLARKYNLPVIGDILVDLAKVNDNIGNLPEADSLFQKGIEESIRNMGNGNPGLAEMYFSYGPFLLKTGKEVQSFQLLRRARNICLGIYGRKHTLTSFANKNIGDAFLTIKNYDSAFYYYQRSLVSVVRGYENTDIYSNPDPRKDTILYNYRLLENLKSKAMAFELLAAEQKTDEAKVKYLSASLSTLDAAMVIIDVLRSDYFSEENRLYLAVNQKGTYMSAANVLFNLYSLTGNDSLKTRMYAVSQEAKVATLLNEITGNALLYSSRVPDSLRTKLRFIQTEIKGYEFKIQNEYTREKPDQNLISELADSKFRLNREKEILDRQMSNLIPGYVELLRRAEPLPYEAVSQRLSRNETVIDYLLSPVYENGKRKLFFFILTQGDLKIRESEIDSSFVNNSKIIRDASDILRSVDSSYSVKNYISALHYMYMTLIEPVEDLVSGHRLIIISDEEIENLPFDAFVKMPPEPDRIDFEGLRFMINDYTISYNYSSSIIVPVKHLAGETRINAFSPSYSGSDMASLKGAEGETTTIYKYFKGNSFTGDSVTRALFLNKMADSAIIHLALHTMTDSLNSIFSYMLFSPAENMDDGRLYNYEISFGRLNSPMVVLSSCNSGVGTLYSGAGLMSIARSFFLAGARSVVKTSWAVNDDSGSEIIKKFYRNLSKGMRKDEALRKAKLDYIKGASPAFSNPYYWAAYSVLGDSRAVIKSKIVTIVTILLVGLLFAGVTGYFIRRRIF